MSALFHVFEWALIAAGLVFAVLALRYLHQLAKLEVGGGAEPGGFGDRLGGWDNGASLNLGPSPVEDRVL